jgi:hypothetical protein
MVSGASYVLVDLEIVLLYEHNDVIYEVQETKRGEYKVVKKYKCG